MNAFMTTCGWTNGFYAKKSVEMEFLFLYPLSFRFLAAILVSGEVLAGNNFLKGTWEVLANVCWAQGRSAE